MFTQTCTEDNLLYFETCCPEKPDLENRKALDSSYNQQVLVSAMVHG